MYVLKEKKIIHLNENTGNSHWCFVLGGYTRDKVATNNLGLCAFVHVILREFVYFFNRREMMEDCSQGRTWLPKPSVLAVSEMCIDW